MKTSTYEKLKNIALSYDTVKSFRAGNKSAYNLISKHGLMIELCSHLDREVMLPRTDSELGKVALRYSSLKRFRKEQSKTYEIIYSRGLVNSICGHMKRERGFFFSIDEFKSEALKYETKVSFLYGSPTIYNKAYGEGILDEICDHMSSKKSTTDNNCLYIWRIKNTNIYKIGITSLKLEYRRIKMVAAKHNVDYDIIAYAEVCDAFKIERELHRTYGTPQSLIEDGDGHTEFKTLTDTEVNGILDYLEKNSENKLIKRFETHQVTKDIPSQHQTI